MTSQKEFLQKLIEALSNSNIPYMLSGSICSSFHGQPRATNDADIVIDPTQDQLIHFIKSLGKDYYVSQQAALHALQDSLMFNVIDMQMGWKADFIVRKKRTYSEVEFSRRIRKAVMGIELCILSPEDSILSKLEWSRAKESQVQLKDALGVLVVQWNDLNFDYLRKWAKELNVEDSLEQLMKEAEKLKRDSK